MRTAATAPCGTCKCHSATAQHISSSGRNTHWFTSMAVPRAVPTRCTSVYVCALAQRFCFGGIASLLFCDAHSWPGAFVARVTHGRHGNSRGEPRGGAFFICCFCFCEEHRISAILHSNIRPNYLTVTLPVVARALGTGLPLPMPTLGLVLDISLRNAPCGVVDARRSRLQ